MEELIEKIAEWLCDFEHSYGYWESLHRTNELMMLKSYRDDARSLLQIQTEKYRLAVVEKEGELPYNPWSYSASPSSRDKEEGFANGIKAMLKDHWVKEVKDGNNS